MKKNFLVIIAIFSVFSSSASANFEQMGEIFDIEHAPEITRLEYGIQTIDTFSFKNIQMQKLHEKFKAANRSVKDSFITAYKNNELSYEAMSDIVTNYNLYIYHINKLFYYQEVKEKSSNYRELDDAIIHHLEQARNSYKKVKYALIESKKEQNRASLFDLYE